MQTKHPTVEIVKHLDQLHAITNLLFNTNFIDKNVERTAKYYIKNIDQLLNNR